jgi:hypothetical protein
MQRLIALREAPALPSSQGVDEVLFAAGLAARKSAGTVAITPAGRAWVERREATLGGHPLDPFTAQHVSVSATSIESRDGPRAVLVDDNESPLGWLARRRGRDGQPLLASHQLAAGERLRAEFTRAQMMPRVTANWQAAVSQGGRTESAGRETITDTIIAARQRVRLALEAAGPEFSGMLLDVCCFLKGLEDVERERAWPARSAKVVLQLALDRLARHYGLASAAHGKTSGNIRAWAETGGDGVRPSDPPS